ncbi:hypothetical protein [Burkholderia vietnamiensis]|uniref:hypothetical protein n=1 Tax=Burkholderia vietnamiensis TaxID=60552 RepID=UPI0012DAD3E5|nr:hypothetical protein [Burkholderia vietnamiensis]MCA8068889.1 hypothetical protein [Burkholderia vietnamiensis]UEC04709.1 hypothetical protein LK462_26170 [Burkholderia vietnamiensis]HDR8988589.1 hypothetical protein [Burkholderia vietnamiensis]
MSFLHRVADLDDPVSMVADTAAIVRQPPANGATRTLSSWNFSDWVEIGFTLEGVLDVEKIRDSCARFPAGGVVLVKASGFESELVIRALSQLRVGLHSIADWPKVFALICDDSQIFQLASPLSTAFFVQPAILNQVAVKRIAERLGKDGKSLRLLGKNIGALASLLRNWSALRRRAEDRKIKREQGWVWEE